MEPHHVPVCLTTLAALLIVDQNAQVTRNVLQTWLVLIANAEILALALAVLVPNVLWLITLPLALALRDSRVIHLPLVTKYHVRKTLNYKVVNCY